MLLAGDRGPRSTAAVKKDLQGPKKERMKIIS